jgi:photosystem II stability/assembly factor-like uncharacterized protein
MRSHGRCGYLRVLALITLCAGPLSPRPAHAQSERGPLEMIEDAELTDVFFLDSDQGWAVGDRGVILHTEDGGRHWQAQRAPETCRFESVHFVDPQIGWVVGGWVHPYTHQTSCAVLRTQDGGRNWTAVSGLTVPALKHVQFLNPQRGWAVGNASALYPTGIFRTEDGGRSWSTLPTSVPGRWTAADFRDFEVGIVAGENGRLARVAVPAVDAVNVAGLGERPLRAVGFSDARRGWLVGDGGLVMHTTDAGLTWQAPPGALPSGVIQLFDFRAMAVFGEHIWAAGAPGTCVLHSSDSGRTWELSRTDQNVPLRAITFVDAQRGWAVGALGTILATRDGGKSWRRLRSGGTRVALLGLCSEPSRLPLELFAWASGNEGYLSCAEILNRRDVETAPTTDALAEDESRAAMSAVGGCGTDHAWRFPLRQEGLRLGSQDLVNAWDRSNDGRSVEMLEELAVRRIRQWRPEVIVTEAASPRGDNPLSHVVNQIVLSAVRNAADATAYPDHATVAGLQPWIVKKVFSVAAADDQPTVTLTTAQLAPRLGCSVADQAIDGYALIRPRYEPLPMTVGFRLLLDELPQAAGRKDIFSGIFLQAGGDARRQQGSSAARDIDVLTRAAQKRRNIEQIFLTTTGGSPQAAGWLAQVQDLTRSLSAANAGQVLYQLAQRYLAAGQMELGAQSLEQLVARYPDHALSENAMVWLIQYYASSEVGWQLRRQTQVTTQVVAAQIAGRPIDGAVEPAGYAQPITESAVANAVPAGSAPPGTASTAGLSAGSLDRAAQALNFAKLVQRGRPGLFAEPWVQFPMSVAYRMKGMPRDAERFYHRLSASPISTDWGRCAQAELWLSHRRGPSPKPVYTCKLVSSRPQLDGRLDDDVWQQAERMELSSAQHDDGTWPATAMLACDEEFLFVAVSCRKAAGAQYPTSPGPRQRDPQLDDHDRVDVLIDLDRDYTSYYRLTMDHRGWTGDACAGNVHWNPVWYVACESTDEDWTVEAAMPLIELTAQRPQTKDVWAVGVQRIVPRVGIQSFTKPARVEPRGEGFALMMFQ